MKKILVLIISIVILSGCILSDDRLPEQKDWVVYNNLKDNNSVAQVKEYILKVAKRPSSVEFIQWSKVSKLSEFEIIDDKYNIEYIVNVDYSAMNGFGGYGRVTYSFYLDKDGKVVACLEDDDYDWDFENRFYWGK